MPGRVSFPQPQNKNDWRRPHKGCLFFLFVLLVIIRWRRFFFRICLDFLFLFLDGQYQEIRAITGDKDRRGLNMPLIRKIEIPVPPVSLQEVFASRLQKISDLKGLHKSALVDLDELFGALQSKAFAGEL